MDEQQPGLAARIRKSGLLLAAVLPAFLAFCGTAWVPRGRPLASEKHLPPLAFRQYAVNLHDVGSVAKVTAPFAFWNRGKENLQITKLEPSCGCLAPKLLGNRKEYTPGSQGLFEVHVDTAREQAGFHAYSIRVHYTVNDQPREELVTFRCQIPERIVTVTPPELYFYQLSDVALQAELQVEDHRGKKLKVLSAVCSSPHLSLTVGEAQETADEHSVIPVQISVDPNLPPGSHHNVITIRTDDPDFSSIQVPVFLQGKPKSSVQLTSGSAAESPTKQSSVPSAEVSPESAP